MSDPVRHGQTSSEAADTDGQSPDKADDVDDDHLSDLEDGAGCTEIWEHLSERRADADARSAELAEE
ncbi:hypothetical protein AUR64_13360 [Haloprofundus marisrubri]|uniref:Uncharacterized protein n=1 Tax=Haloprofundus marisrubri TaxID=1514971 RepID=A0A0W1R717_9EURY|nr:hypothetical protein [Haloprofundus marisrubri]KTG08804.1 hypothetical protein AUR64_13360 [Haloprofundus marisrubri]